MQLPKLYMMKLSGSSVKTSMDEEQEGASELEDCEGPRGRDVRSVLFMNVWKIRSQSFGSGPPVPG